jgi:hypothetical protein
MPLQEQIKRDAWGSQLPSTAIPSGQKGPGGFTIATGPGVFLGVIIVTDGANDVTVDFYDKLSSGDDTEKLIPSFVVPADGQYGGVIPPPVGFATGLYMVVSGVGAKVVAYYMV